jgi:methyl-accepting chemotaxis protein
MKRIGSIQLRIAFWTGICLLLAAAIIIGYAVTTLRTTAIRQAEDKTLARAKEEAAHIEAEIEEALVTARTLGATIGAVKAPINPLRINRDQANAMLENLLSHNPKFLDVWTIWEPDAFDGRDSEFAGKAPYDQSGRYNVYLARNEKGEIETTFNTGYEDGTAVWYEVPKAGKRETILEPFIYNLLGKDEYIIALVMPVVANDQFQGEFAVDIRTDFLQQLADESDIYDRNGKLTLFSAKGALLGVTGRPELLGKPLTEVYPSSVLQEDLPRVQKGEEFTKYIGDQLAVFVPITIGETKTLWGIGVLVPSAAIVAEANSVMWRMVGVGALLIAIALGLLWVVSGQLVRPIKQLTGAAEAVAGGDLNHRVAVESRDELGTLGATFNQMIDSLQTSRESAAAAQERERELREAETTTRQNLETTVGEYLGFVQQVAQGDLGVRLAVTQNGSLGQLGAGLNEMVTDLQKITAQVQQAATNIASVATEILAATTQQAASATEQSAAISQTSTTIEEIKVIATQTAQQASQVARDSQNALSAARQGTQAVEETVHGMGQIRQRVESIATTILGLAEQTQTIGDIITTVNQLSDQSNLLALNAAIEAARAGEQGKSFAVVAQHVRDLAERSKSATAQVRGILGEIQRATNTAVLVTDEGTKGVEVGATLAGQAGQVIHRIAAEVELGAQSNVQMAAAAQQQTAGMEQIGQAMTAIQQATTQTLASTRQAEQAAQDLHALARSLQTTVALYRL